MIVLKENELEIIKGKQMKLRHVDDSMEHNENNKNTYPREKTYG